MMSNWESTGLSISLNPVPQKTGDITGWSWLKEAQEKNLNLTGIVFFMKIKTITGILVLGLF
jgi:hypothetical protein